MSSVFGDDGIEDLFNDNIQDENNLPSDDERQENEDNEQLETAGDAEDPIKVDPKKPKRVARNPRLKLSIETLSGPRGIQTIENYYKDIRFAGKGYEKNDLDEIMHRLQHWAHRMFPNYTFEDVLNNIERLGKKKPLQVHFTKYRMGMLQEMILNENDLAEEEDEAVPNAEVDEPYDEFDALLGEQIAISKLVPHTPATTSKQRLNLSTAPSTSSMSFSTPSISKNQVFMSTPNNPITPNYLDYSDLVQPLPPSQPEETQINKQLTSEQKTRMDENRRIALERLKAKKEQIQKDKGA